MIPTMSLCSRQVLPKIGGECPSENHSNALHHSSEVICPVFLDSVRSASASLPTLYSSFCCFLRWSDFSGLGCSALGHQDLWARLSSWIGTSTFRRILHRRLGMRAFDRDLWWDFGSKNLGVTMLSGITSDNTLNSLSSRRGGATSWSWCCSETICPRTAGRHVSAWSFGCCGWAGSGSFSRAPDWYSQLSFYLSVLATILLVPFSFDYSYACCSPFLRIWKVEWRLWCHRFLVDQRCQRTDPD